MIEPSDGASGHLPVLTGPLPAALSALPAAVQLVLTLAAVIGPSFNLRVLRQAGEAADLDPLDLVAEAESAGILAPSIGALGQYQFVDPTVRDALYAAIPSARRARLHQRVATALEPLWGGDPERLIELAWQFIHAAPAGEAGLAFEYAVRAAIHATNRDDYHEAVRLYEAALGVLELAGPVDVEERAVLLLRLGDAQHHAGLRQQATSTFARAADHARAIESPSRSAVLLARAALGMGQLTNTAGATQQLLLRLLDEALTALGDAEPGLRARTLARRAQALAFAGEVVRAGGEARAAIALARHAGDQAALAYCLTARGYSLSGAEELAERGPLAREVLALAHSLEDSDVIMRGHRLQIAALLDDADMAGVDVAIEAVSVFAASRRRPTLAIEAAEHRVMRALLDGDLAAAEARLAEAQALQAGAPHADASNVADLYLYAIRREQDRGAEIADSILSARRRYPGIRTFRALYALLLCELGRLEEARGEFTFLKAGDFVGLPRERAWFVRAAYLAEIAHHLGEVAAARALYTLLSPYRSRVVLNTAITCLGSVERYLALAAATVAGAEAESLPPAGYAGWWQAALVHHAAALSHNLRLGARGLVAHCRREYALTLRAAPTAVVAGDDATLAGQLALEARADAEVLGMRRLQRLLGEITIDLASFQQLPPPPAPAAGSLMTAGPGASLRPDDARLTEREREILVMVCQGRTNADIAEAFSLSRRTVERHVANIYTKIDAHSKAEAVAWAIRHGLA